MRRPVVLMILDGWGLSDPGPGNAATGADTPRLDALFRDYPSTRLQASGEAVGLPAGQMGNSEVGHLNIGAGRVVYQDLTRISSNIASGEFFANPVLQNAMRRTREQGSRLHLMGLLSDGGVHSLQDHLYALVEMAGQEGIEEVFIHAFMDGRDTPPKSGVRYLEKLEKKLEEIGRGRVATVTGRFYAMDRDHRWNRIERAYRAMTGGEGRTVSDSREAVETAYAEGQTDEFIEPRVICRENRPVGRVRDGDGLIFFNFRADRAREITRAFTEEDFSGFRRPESPELAVFVCMTEYDESFDLPVAFPPEPLPNLLGEIIAAAGRRQLRIAETEKYAHVTFFFNGGDEPPNPGEDRVLIPSPREISTYDQQPAMSARPVTAEVVEKIRGGDYDFMVLNFANPDMVGHTGLYGAAVEAMEVIDECVGRVVDVTLEEGGCLLITADHGNCEQMADQEGEPHTAHTANPVPLILVAPSMEGVQLREGTLADIAPTVLQLMELEKPAEMTGRSLIQDQPR